MVDLIRAVLLRQVNTLPHRDNSRNTGCNPTQSQYTDTEPTSPSTVPMMSGARRGAARIHMFRSLV